MNFTNATQKSKSDDEREKRTLKKAKEKEKENLKEINFTTKTKLKCFDFFKDFSIFIFYKVIETVKNASQMFKRNEKLKMF